MQMPHPGAMPGVPEGLEYLAAVDQLIIKQEVELMEGQSLNFLDMFVNIICISFFLLFISFSQAVLSVLITHMHIHLLSFIQGEQAFMQK